MDSTVSSSNTPDPILAALHAATRREDVRSIVANYPADRVQQAWNKLDRLTKSSLLLTREFNGTIIAGQSELV